MKTKSLIVLAILAVLSFATVSQATVYSGTITGGSGGGIFGTTPWGTETTTFDYYVSNEEAAYADLWYYSYTLTVPRKSISHMIIEVSDTFTRDNIFNGTTAGWQLDTWGTQGTSNPGIPEDVYGLKWDFSGEGEILSANVIIVSNRMPMLGEFYAKDGKSGGNDVYAFSGNSDGFIDNIWVPDTKTNQPVPEPSTMLLLGGGLVGLALYRKRSKK